VKLKELLERAAPGVPADALAELDRKAAALEGSPIRRGEKAGGGARAASLAQLAGSLHRLLDVLQGADATPTTQAVAACAETQKALGDLRRRWGELKERDI